MLLEKPPEHVNIYDATSTVCSHGRSRDDLLSMRRAEGVAGHFAKNYNFILVRALLLLLLLLQYGVLLCVTSELWLHWYLLSRGRP